MIVEMDGSHETFQFEGRKPARRDLSLLAAAARDVHVGFAVSIAIGDEELHSRLEPGTSSPRARLDLVRAVTDAGLPCHVMVAPVIPHLSDDDAAIDALLARIAAAGATSATVLALHLRPGTREWWFTWLERAEPALVPAYRSLYGRGTYATSAYRDDLARRVRPLLERHGLAARHAAEHRQVGTVTTTPAVTVPTLF